jgi:UDP-N-acetylmuramyl tripeptide synthase
MNFPNISILVDYAHEPESMRRLLETLADWRRRQQFDYIIHILSCDGAGRDDWKKAVMGSISYSNVDFTIVTTDNYDSSDNPELILKLISENFSSNDCLDIAKIQDGVGGYKWSKTIDRKKAFENSLLIAKKYSESNPESKVLIVSTGVGCEQVMIQPEGEILRDEREVWRKVFAEFESNYKHVQD